MLSFFQRLPGAAFAGPTGLSLAHLNVVLIGLTTALQDASLEIQGIARTAASVLVYEQQLRAFAGKVPRSDLVYQLCEAVD